jgi:CheY-like chemotaxis protein
MMESAQNTRSGGRIKPILLAAAMAFLALNVWTGSPLLAVWIGAKVQGEESQPSMGAYAVVIISLIAFSWGLYQLLKVVMSAYQDATGTATVELSLTALAQEKDRERAMKHGYREHVTKPPDPQKLVEVVARTRSTSTPVSSASSSRISSASWKPTTTSWR